MKKSLLFLLPAFLLLAGCVVQGGQDVAVPEADAAEAAVARAVPLEEALEEMYSLMEAIEPGTRSSRTVGSVEVVGGKNLGNVATRSGTPIPDSLLYLVNFDEGGFSVLAADVRLQAVLALAMKGQLSQQAFANLWSDTPELTLEDRWDEETQEYLLGGAEPEEFVAQIVLSAAFQATINTNLLTELSIDNSVIGDGGLINPGSGGVHYTYHFSDWFVDEAATKRRVLDDRIRWHQGSPFNDLCPSMDDGCSNASAGCVAIATMQILAHHKRPPCSQLYYYGVDPPSGVVWGDLIASRLSEIFDPMVDLPGARYAAAEVSLHIGKGCDMRYNIVGDGQSFAFPSKAKSYLSVLGYNTDLLVGFKKTKIKEEVKAGRPVLIGAVGDFSNAHAWVVDGYMERYANYIKRGSDGSEKVVGKKTQKLFHCNWGWRGSCDGYFALPEGGGGTEFDLSSRPDYTEDGDGGGTNSATYFNWLFHTVTVK